MYLDCVCAESTLNNLSQYLILNLCVLLYLRVSLLQDRGKTARLRTPWPSLLTSINYDVIADNIIPNADKCQDTF